ncbi:autotransporter domain-containing protein [Succinivibrio dextrinosolvens]|uniref:autotransporter domain-containing protein n=1 Tax=Succinivibrio dextrinosolvens TaxID=83771 RepID=UPI00241EE305|nr:autotransporter domain-containing protein [Succinivibrio dextrinosolvens]
MKTLYQKLNRNKTKIFTKNKISTAIAMILLGVTAPAEADWAWVDFGNPLNSIETNLPQDFHFNYDSAFVINSTGGFTSSIVNNVAIGYFVSSSVNDYSLINHGTINLDTANLYIGYAKGATANNNTLDNDGSITVSTLYGGYSQGSPIVTAEANGNTINITGGSVTASNLNGGYSDGMIYAHANGNTIKITGGNVTVNTLTGGYAGASGEITASGNKVILGAGKYTNVYGGRVENTGLYTSPSGRAIDNEIYIYGNTDLSVGGLTGGEVVTSGYSTITGNKLIFGYSNTAWAPASYVIGNVKNFSTIRFDNATWGKTITVYYFANQSTDSTVTKVDATNVAFSGVDSLSSGDSYDMLTIQELASGSLELTSENSTYTIGTSLEGTGRVSLSEDGKTVTYTVDSASEKASSQSHSAAMAMSAGTVALNQGADTTSAAGFNLANSGTTGLQAFSSVGGGESRVETGSFVSLKTLNFSVGIGNNIKNDYGLLSIGGAFETGYGKFKNHFDAGSADPYIKKTGHVSYYGLALLSNFTFENLWHVNGAVRVGRMESTQNNALYNAATSETYNINIGTNYYGLELGGGKLVKIDDSNSVDIYGKYFYLYQDSDTFNAGGKYKLSAVNSHRLRVAGRYSHDFTPVISLYGGLGLEHEFDGKSKLKVDDKAWAKSSKTKGTRAFGEIGVAVKPASNTGLILDFSLKGLYGDNFRGAWASADIKYMF